MYLLDGAPRAASGHNTVLCRGGDEVGLIGASHSILNELATGEEWQNTHVAYVSRTTEAPWAHACLRLLRTTPQLTMDEQASVQVCPWCCAYHTLLYVHDNDVHVQRSRAHCEQLLGCAVW